MEETKALLLKCFNNIFSGFSIKYTYTNISDGQKTIGFEFKVRNSQNNNIGGFEYRLSKGLYYIMVYSAHESYDITMQDEVHINDTLEYILRKQQVKELEYSILFYGRDIGMTRDKKIDNILE